jgi:putative cell wall-binding protein
MVGSMIGVAAGTAGAATVVVGSFKSPNGTTTSIPSGTTKNQVIGTLVLTISRTVKKATFTGQTITLTVKDTTTHAGSYAAFTKVNSTAHLQPAVVGPGTVSTACALTTKTNHTATAGQHFSAAATAYLKITCTIAKTAGTVTATGKTATAVFTWRTLRVESITGQGTVNVAVADTLTATDHFTKTTATAAKYTTAAPTSPKKVLLKNDTTRPVPPVGLAQEGATVGSWSLKLTAGAAGTHPTARGVLTSGHVKITIEPHTGHSVCVTTKTIAFDGLPKVAVAAVTSTTLAATKIKISDSLSGNNGCTGFFAPNVLTVTFTSTVHFTKATGFITISITTVKYSVAPKTATGTVTVSDIFFRSSATPTGTALTATNTQGVTITSTNAIVSAAYVHVATLKKISPTAYDQPIGTIAVVESAPGSVTKGYVCITLTASTRTTTGTGIYGHTSTANPITPHATSHHATGRTTTVPPPSPKATDMNFNTTSKPTVKVTSGNGAVSTVGFSTTGLVSKTVYFEVTAASTTPSTYTVSGLAVNGNTRTTRRALVTAFYSASSTCTAATGKPTDHAAVAVTTGKKISTEIYGSTAAGTAVQELEHAFPALAGTTRSCPRVTPRIFGTATSFLGRTERAIVLATSKTYPDALASQYLAGRLGTGTVLTAPTALTLVTATALRVEGISHVYVAGGPLAVDTTVVSKIETMPVYRCGGNGLARNSLNQTGTIQVTRIGGQTLYTTAEMLAETPPADAVNHLRLPAAYTGGPTSHGQYNDTTGIGSTKVASGGFLATAILADGQEFQDAEAASALAWNTSIPILLTTPTALSAQAKTGIVNLHIRQVIVMGGTKAITNTVVKAVAAMTVTGHPVSVLRVGGKDYTDTAVQLAKLEVNDTPTAGLDWDPTTLLIARGNGYTDGIAGAVLEHLVTTAPQLLTESQTTVGTYLTTFLKTAGKAYDTATNKVTHLLIEGGPLAVTPAIIAQMVTDL